MFEIASIDNVKEITGSCEEENPHSHISKKSGRKKINSREEYCLHTSAKEGRFEYPLAIWIEGYDKNIPFKYIVQEEKDWFFIQVNITCESHDNKLLFWIGLCASWYTRCCKTNREYLFSRDRVFNLGCELMMDFSLTKKIKKHPTFVT